MNAKVGDTIKAGQLVLLTSGCYSSYGVNGLYRATADTVIPGTPAGWGRKGELEPDIHMLSTMLEEVPYTEVWQDS